MIRQTTVLSLILTIFVGTILFVIKNEVHDLENKLQKISREIVTEKEKQHILRAEWSHLNEPNRIRQLIFRHLTLKPLDAEQFFNEDQLPELIENRVHSDVKPHIFKNDNSFESFMKKALNGEKSE